jgi:hypothetical protein
MIAEIDRLPLVSAEDYLFKGYLISNIEPLRGLTLLDEAIRQRPSVIARAIRAEVRTVRTVDTGSLADAELALKDANAAKEMLPGNPVVLWRSMFAHAIASGVYQQAGRARESQAALTEAENDMRALDSFTALPDVVVGRWFYCWFVDKSDTVLEELRLASERTNDPWVGYAYALSLYRRGDCQQAFAVLSRRQGAGNFDYLRVFIMAEQPDGPAGALRAYQDLAARYQTGTVALYNQLVLRFLGRKSEAVAASLTFRQHPERLPPIGKESYQRLVDYSCELITEEELLGASAHSNHDLCRAHFFIAMTKLAEGNRHSAAEHLRKCVATRDFIFVAWFLSRIFLARMEKDPTWPPWLKK